MHGLGDGPYWMITYGYFLALSAIYMLCFVIFGSVLGKNIIIWLSILGILPLFLMLLTSFSGLKFFTLNDYSIQFVFYFIYINLQISTAFLLSSFFANVKTATGLFLLQVVYSNGCIGIFFSQISLLTCVFDICSNRIYRCLWNRAIRRLSFPIFCARNIISK
jgi:hypothetical protein